MTPAHLILGGIATSLICTIGICVLILVERRRAKHRAHINELFEPMASNWRARK